MKYFLCTVLALFFITIGHGQSLTAKDYIGTWQASVNESRAKSMDMLFDGSTIILNADMTYYANVIEEFDGNWLLQGDSIILDSQKMPSPLILSELSSDSCIWTIDKVRARIPFFKESKDNSPIHPSKATQFVDVDIKDISGEWTNTHVEDPSKTNRQNIFLFGDSELNEKLYLDKSGQFFMPRSSIRLKVKDNASGTWSIEGGIITLKFESGEAERLGISKFTTDSLVLVDLGTRELPMIGESKIRITYTKRLAAGLQKYIIHPEVRDTLYSFNKDLGVVIEVPKNFDEIYDLAGRTVVTLSLLRCLECSSIASDLEALKEDLINKERLNRFIESSNEDFIIHESKMHITDNIYYELIYAFPHKDEVYYIKVTSFLEENVRIIGRSIEGMTIID